MKYIIFDFDGPLFDARKVAGDTIQEVFNRFELPITIEMDKISLTSPNNFVRACMDKYKAFHLDAQEVTKVYYNKLEMNELSAELRKGMAEVLEQLKANGNNLFIVSDRSEKRLRMLLSKFDVDKYFEDILGRERYGLKPSQGSVNYLKETFGVVLENAWMVGDSDVDYQYAKMAGFHYAYAAYSSEPSEISFEKCDFVLKREKDLLLI